MDLTGEQKKTILAAYLGWMLDAFDFFLLTFLLKDIAKEFGVEVPAVSYALFLTLAMRFVGAFIFGRLGDRWGRKPALMLDIQHQSRLASPPIAESTEDERADEPHRERQEQSVGDRRHLDAEFLGDVLEQKGQKEEVEGVEHPAE